MYMLHKDEIYKKVLEETCSELSVYVISTNKYTQNNIIERKLDRISKIHLELFV